MTSPLRDDRLAEIRYLRERMSGRLTLAASLCITEGHVSSSTLDDITTGMAELLAEVDRLREDAARLDWLDADEHVNDLMVNRDSYGIVDEKNPVWLDAVDTEDRPVPSVFPSVRAAIDAARGRHA